MDKWVNIIVGGIAGTVSRYLVAGVVHRVVGTGFPYGTLMVNLVGCFLIGFLAALSEVKFLLSSNARLLLMIGFCGAFTTFSTFMFETASLMRDGENFRAFLNVAVSVVGGFLVFKLGVWSAEVI